MDTKLKKFNDSLAVRVCAFIVCIAMLMVCATTVFIGAKKISDMQNSSFGINIDDLSGSNSYFDTDSFGLWAESAVYYMQALSRYGNIEDIKAGKFVDKDEVASELEARYDSLYGEEVTKSNSKYYELDGLTPEEALGGYLDPKPFAEVKDVYAKENPDLIKKIRRQIITNQLEAFDDSKLQLDNLKGVFYSVKMGNKVIATNGQIEKAGFTMNVKDGVVQTTPEIENLSDKSSFNYIMEDQSAYGNSENKNIEYTLILDESVNDKINKEFADAKAVFNAFSIIAVITFIVFLLLLIYLLIITGRRDGNGNVKLYRGDRLFTEIQFIIFFGLCGLAITPFYLLVYSLGDLSLSSWMNETSNIAIIILGVALEAIVTSAILWFGLSIIRMIKAHIFVERSLLVIAIKALYKWIRATFSHVNPMGKFVIIIVAACMLSMTRFLAPVVIVLILGFGYRWIRKYNEVKKGLDEVNNGNLEYKIPVNEESKNEFDQLAKQINAVSMASNVAIQNELKNQRLKTDLISNVSHDLKTPLTSIITYTDLLKKEGLNSPNAMNYLNVIDDKGQRLKNLTEDLFEAAKASSGSIPIRLEKVDILSLINQGLVELGEGIDAKGLDVIVNSDEDRYYVNADSQLIWRVVENLLNNIEKYALENSRVYIDLGRHNISPGGNSMVMFEMKNISRSPLNIPEEELMERFKRGDESRTTEGSGLGLAIAKDLTRLQNGLFEVKIDGDLFKSTVMLESYDEATVKASEEAAQKQVVKEGQIYSQQKDDMPRNH